MVTLYFSPASVFLTLHGEDALVLVASIVAQAELVVGWGLKRQLIPALQERAQGLDTSRLALLDLEELLRKSTDQTCSIGNVYAQTFGEPELLVEEDETALFKLGRHDTCIRLSHDACRRLQALHLHAVDLGFFLFGTYESNVPDCVTLNWRQMWPLGE
jgi:hypothetical protein